MLGTSSRRAVAAAVLAAALLSPALPARTGSAGALPANAPPGDAVVLPFAPGWLDALRSWVQRLLAGCARGPVPAAAADSAPPPATTCPDRGASSDPDGKCPPPTSGGS
jgi:hypothetical protein